MLFKVLCATLLISSGEALKVSAGVSRRAAIAKAASVALPFVIAPAFAEEDRKLKRAGDSDIYARADAETLMADRTIKRAQAGDLADGSSATVMDATTQTELAAVFPKAWAWQRGKEPRGDSRQAQQAGATAQAEEAGKGLLGAASRERWEEPRVDRGLNFPRSSKIKDAAGPKRSGD